MKVIAVNPRGTSSTCPRFGSKLIEKSYRVTKCPVREFEADRDLVAVLNIEKRALIKMEGALAPAIPQQMKDVSPNRCGEPMNPLKGTSLFSGEEVSIICNNINIFQG